MYLNLCICLFLETISEYISYKIFISQLSNPPVWSGRTFVCNSLFVFIPVQRTTHRLTPKCSLVGSPQRDSDGKIIAGGATIMTWYLMENSTVISIMLFCRNSYRNLNLSL